MKQVFSNHGKKIASILSILLLATSFLAACSSKSEDTEQAKQKTTDSANSSKAAADSSKEKAKTYPLTVTDELGNEVTIPTKPTRIFAPAMEDSLVALGIKPVLQWANSVQPQLYLQDQLSDIPEINFTSGRPPAGEAIMAYEPDLIVLHHANYAKNDVYEQYSKIAPTYVFKNASGDLNSSIQVLGQLLDEQDKAEQALQNYNKKMEEARLKLASVTEGKKVALIRFNQKGTFFMGYDSFGGYVLTHELGFEQSSLVKDGALEVSFEILPELDADYIFLVNGNMAEDYLKELKESKIWQSMPAVKNGQAYEVSGDYWGYGGVIAHEKVVEEAIRFLLP
jgi:iron complex transport system substrate-binding protein